MNRENYQLKLNLFFSCKLIKTISGQKFRPWSNKFHIDDRYTNLQIDSETGKPCGHLHEETKCQNPIDVGQCDFFESMQQKLKKVSEKTWENTDDYLQSDIFEETVELLESGYFLMNQNQTKQLMSFEHIQQIDVIQSKKIHGKNRRAAGDQMLGPFPDHDGGHFKKINPLMTVEFFRYS